MRTYINTLINRLKEHKHLSEFINYNTFFQFVKYIITGILSAGSEMGILVFFKEIVHIHTIIANSIAYLTVFWINFLLSRYWSFKSKADLGVQLRQYGLLFLFNLALSNLLIYSLTKYLGMHYIIAKIIIMALIVAWNFIIYKKIIYKH